LALARVMAGALMPVPTLKLHSSLSVRVGDVLLLPDRHVALYREQVDLDGASIGIRVTEAASRCGAVCDSIYEIDHFQDYMQRRFGPKR
jgi:hypothetical protein